MGDTTALQRYLGLAPAAIRWQEEIFTRAWQSESERARYASQHDVVFICVDLEAYEFAQDKITEIGIASVDTRKLAVLPPGAGATAWLSQIECQHIRIDEYKHLINKRFIHGCPDKFNFGQSYLVPLEAVAQVLGGIFAGRDREQNEARNVVLVGHDIGRDIDYLARLNFNPSYHAKIVDKLDTQRLGVSTKKAPVGLAKLLHALDIEAHNLHNAGNDAAYTLQALLKIVISETEQPGHLKTKLIEMRAIEPPRTEEEKKVLERKRQAREKEKEAKRVQREAAQKAAAIRKHAEAVDPTARPGRTAREAGPSENHRVENDADLRPVTVFSGFAQIVSSEATGAHTIQKKRRPGRGDTMD